MKKLLAILLGLMFVGTTVMTVGCGGDDDDDSSQGAQAPVVTITQPLPDQHFGLGGTVALRAVVTDLDSTPGDITGVWTSTVDGDLATQVASPSNELSLNRDDLTAGVHTVA